MLESLVAWVLNNYVGEYLNLNTDQLSIALLQGQVDLENVTLRGTALRKFDIPLLVKSGVIGKLQLQIPIAHIRSQPWILKMSDFLVVLGPRTSTYDVEIVDQYQQQKREKMLDELEILHKKQLLSLIGVEPREDKEQDSWWGASLLSTVSNNIQIILDNVHIKYECPSYSFGVRIQSLIIQTTNSNWRPGFVQSVDGVNIFKRFDIAGLSIYWNPNEQKTPAHQFDSPDCRKAEMGRADANNSFILQPFSMDVRIEKNSSRFPLATPHVPRFKLDIRSRKIELELNRQQIAQIQSLVQDWAQFERARPHRKWRPIVVVHESPKQWWRFAIGRVLEDVRTKTQSCSRKTVCARMRLMNAYCGAYRRRLSLYMDAHSKSEDSQKSSVSIPHEDTALIKQIEHDAQFNYSVLHSLREAVFQKFSRVYEIGKFRAENDNSPFEMIQAKRSKPERVEEQLPAAGLQQLENKRQEAANSSSGWYGWMSSWFSGGDENANEDANEDVNEAVYLHMRPPKLTKHDLHPELAEVERRMEKEILQMLNETLDDSDILRRDNLLAEIMLKFSQVFLRFTDEKRDENAQTSVRSLLTFDLSRLCSRIQFSPKEHRIEASLSVGDMSLQRMQILPDADATSSKAVSPNAPFDEHSAFKTSPPGDEVSSIEDDYELESLCGFRSSGARNTRLLLTLGRTYDEENALSQQRRRKKLERHRTNEEEEQRGTTSILQLFYKRLAPKQEIYHEVSLTCAPLSMICDECALSGLFDIFDTEQPIQRNMANEAELLPDVQLPQQIFVSISMPELIVELRSEKAAMNYLLINELAANEDPSRQLEVDVGVERNFGMDSQPFVRVKIASMGATFARRDCQHLSKLNVWFENVLAEDLLQGGEEFALVRTVENDDWQQGDENEEERYQSCPDLHAAGRTTSIQVDSLPPFVAAALGTSLPTASTLMRRMESAQQKNSSSGGLVRPRIGTMQGDLARSRRRRHNIKVLFVEKENPLFESAHKKNNCKIVGKFDDAEIELGINRRTWILFLDFFGLLSGQNGGAREGSRIDNNYLVECELSCRKVRVAMNFPKNGSQLGICTLDQPKLSVLVDLNVVEEPIQMAMSAHELYLSDSSPFGSLYQERLNIRGNGSSTDSSPMRLSILKFRTEDPDCRLRDFDASVMVEVDGHVNFVHTHRYFCALMDFWLQFAELHDKVTLNNLHRLRNKLEPNVLKTRCQVDVRLASTCIFLPLNQHSPKAIVMECSAIKANNAFCYSSALSELLDKALANHNRPPSAQECLLDMTNILLGDLRIRYGTFVQRAREQQFAALSRQKGVERFDAFNALTLFSLPTQTMMDQPNFSISLDIYRNLSSLISHSVPELFCMFRLQNAVLHFTTEFYKLLRGCLDHNFGEQLIPQPETIPIELLELPETNVEFEQKYSMITLRIVLKKVQFLLRTPVSSIQPDVYEDFARLNIRSAKLFYDCFVDAQSEFDFICENATLEDARGTDDGGKENMFRKIVQAGTNLSAMAKDPSAARTRGESGEKRLLFEAHIQMKPEEPPVISLILARARVILLMDWIERLKAFILLNTEFNPEREHRRGPNFEVEMPKSGVLVRKISSALSSKQPMPLVAQSSVLSEQQLEGKFTMKVTLKECDLVALEDHQRKDTFALIVHTTAAIASNNLADTQLIESQCEIQQFCLFWCLMGGFEEDTRSQLTNDTNATVSISYELPPGSTSSGAKMPVSRLMANQTQKSIEHLLGKQRQVINVELGPLVVKGTLKDFFIAKHLTDEFLRRWEVFQESEIRFLAEDPSTIASLEQQQQQQQLFPSETTDLLKMNIASGTEMRNAFKLIAKVDRLCAWLLDEDGNSERDTTTPFLRFNLSELHVQSMLCKTQLGFDVSVDYYRLRSVPGWEPLVEHWRKLLLDVSFAEQSNQWNVRLRPAVPNVLELNLTQAFVERALSFSAKWQSVRATLFDVSPQKAIARLREMSTRRSGFSSSLAPNEQSSSGRQTTAAEHAYSPRQPLPEMYSVGSHPSGRPRLAEIVEKSHLRPATAADRKIRLIDPKQISHSVDFQLELDAGLGISVVADTDADQEGTSSRRGMQPHQQEELLYARMRRIQLKAHMHKGTVQLNCHVGSIQVDNQLLGTDRWHFMFFDPVALNDESPLSSTKMGIPSLIFEMRYTATEYYDVYDCFRLKLCNSCIFLDEQLLWRLVHFVQNISSKPAKTSHSATGIAENDANLATPTLYFGTFQLEFGSSNFSVLTVGKGVLPPVLRQLKESYSDRLILFSFENAMVTLAPFCMLRYFCSFDKLLESLANFYIEELKRQKLNIIFALDAFGNPLGLTKEITEGVQGLLFEGDLAGFTFGLGHGTANSISKFASSMAQGVGSMTFDEDHEQLRRRMCRAKPEQASAITHFYGGVKGLGVGLFGALTALPKNTIVGAQKDGVTGIARGIVTGVCDTITKPIQGTLDLVEGTASAFKEVIGAPLVKSAHFPDSRLRLSRVCSSLNGLLPAYQTDMAEAQIELLRITGKDTLTNENRLLSMVHFLDRLSPEGMHIRQRALVTLLQCHVIRQVDDQPSAVVYRILFQHLRVVQVASPASTKEPLQTRFIPVEVHYHQQQDDGAGKKQRKFSQQPAAMGRPQPSSSEQRPQPALTLWCTDKETAQRLCKQIMRAKALFDHGIGKEQRSSGKKTSSSIFTI